MRTVHDAIYSIGPNHPDSELISKWNNYVTRGCLDVLHYLDEKGIEYMTGSAVGHGNMRRRFINIYIENPPTRLYREVVIPGMVDVANKWNALVEFEQIDLKRIIKLKWCPTRTRETVLQ